MLEKARGSDDSDSNMIDRLLMDPTKIQMKFMNGYLNNYTEKLARANADDPSDIQIDKQDLYLIAKSVRADAFNPYLHAEGLKDNINSLQVQSNALGKSRQNNVEFEKRIEA